MENKFFRIRYDFNYGIKLVKFWVINTCLPFVTLKMTLAESSTISTELVYNTLKKSDCLETPMGERMDVQRNPDTPYLQARHTVISIINMRIFIRLGFNQTFSSILHLTPKFKRRTLTWRINLLKRWHFYMFPTDDLDVTHALHATSCSIVLYIFVNELPDQLAYIPSVTVIIIVKRIIFWRSFYWNRLESLNCSFMGQANIGSGQE